MERFKIKILAAVWGQSYVEQFARFSLASLMAPGNIPHLAEHADIELVILTAEADESLFEALPIMAHVKRHASVRYVAIDDLIRPGLYSVTLTLAFTRGMAVFGAAMTACHFIYWNADFVLSDRGFTHLLKLIQRGDKVVITGTLRAVSTEAEPLLAAMRKNPDAPLSVSARELVRLAFSFQHPHHVAKTINQTVAWTSMPSQMLWRVDANTQVGRFFQAFMFCLRPTRAVTKMNGPCDYTFVPEFCPGEAQHVINDSDDAFILELQPRESEAEFIRIGSRDDDIRRTSMQEWLTAEHLDSARTSIVFRAGPTPVANIETGHAALSAYFEDFTRPVRPNPHANQYYWTYGVAAWFARKPGGRIPVELEARLQLDELEHSTYTRMRGHVRTPVRRGGRLRPLRSALVGPPLSPENLHPHARAYRFLSDALGRALSALKDGETRILAVASFGAWLDRRLPFDNARIFRIEPYALRYWRLTSDRPAQAALIYLRPSDEGDLTVLLTHAAGALAPGATVTLLLHALHLNDGDDWIERQLRSNLTLQGLLEGFTLQKLEARASDVAYAERLQHAAGDFFSRRPLRMMAGVFHAAYAVVARWFAAKDAPGQRLWAAVITGRFQPPPQLNA